MTHTTFLAEEDARFHKELLYYFISTSAEKKTIDFLHASHQRSLERLRGEVEKIKLVMTEEDEKEFQRISGQNGLREAQGQYNSWNHALDEVLALLSTNQ